MASLVLLSAHTPVKPAALNLIGDSPPIDPVDNKSVL
jgi:hypothetical protein